MLVHYLILGVPSDASDQRIRDRYLELVKMHTPESDPVKFRQINEAYEAIRTKRRRIAGHLFGGPGTRDEQEILRLMAGTREVKRKRLGLGKLFETEKRIRRASGK